jgi:hypothetical protein
MGEKLISAVAAHLGLSACLLKQPKGGRNFGLPLSCWGRGDGEAQRKESWARCSCRVRRCMPGYAQHLTIFASSVRGGETGAADQGLYADFLVEAGILLNQPVLNEVSDLFRKSARAWLALSQALLPDEIELLGETRRLMLQRHASFLAKGCEALEEMRQIDSRLSEIKAHMRNDFPLDETGVASFFEEVRTHILRVHDVEWEAIESLKAAMG